MSMRRMSQIVSGPRTGVRKPFLLATWRYVFIACELLFALSWRDSAVRAGDPAIAESPAARTICVAAVQMRSTRDLSANIESIDKHLAYCARVGARVAVFPECALTGYFDNAFMQAITSRQLAEAERDVAESCRKHHIYAVVGTPTRDGDRLFNSAVVFTPKGEVLVRYHKIQLAESWPVAGHELLVFKIDDVPASIIICHDERYPELVRLPVLAGSRLVFYLSHESGLVEESKIAPYRAQIQARAVENSVYVVQANAPANNDLSGSHGQSRLVAPDGNIITEASMLSEEVVFAELDFEDATGKMARHSVERGPLGDWWRAGIARVRMIDK